MSWRISSAHPSTTMIFCLAVGPETQSYIIIDWTAATVSQNKPFSLEVTLSCILVIVTEK
jgi:hypothetical protein